MPKPGHVWPMNVSGISDVNTDAPNNVEPLSPNQFAAHKQGLDWCHECPVLLALVSDSKKTQVDAWMRDIRTNCLSKRVGFKRNVPVAKEATCELAEVEVNAQQARPESDRKRWGYPQDFAWSDWYCAVSEQLGERLPTLVVLLSAGIVAVCAKPALKL